MHALTHVPSGVDEMVCLPFLHSMRHFAKALGVRDLCPAIVVD